MFSLMYAAPIIAFHFGSNLLVPAGMPTTGPYFRETPLQVEFINWNRPPAVDFDAFAPGLKPLSTSPILKRIAGSTLKAFAASKIYLLISARLAI